MSEAQRSTDPAEVWPDVLETLLYPELETARRVALQHVDSAGLLALLHKMPAAKRAKLAREVGLAPGAPVSRGMAAALSNRLANSGSVSVQTAGLVFRPLRRLFFCPNLTVTQWTALLSGRRAGTLAVMAAEPHLAWHALQCEQTVPGSLLYPGLAVATYTAGPGGQVPAVAFLSAHDPVLAEAYAGLRERYPVLPAAAASIEDIMPRTLAARAANEADFKRVDQIFSTAKEYGARAIKNTPEDDGED